MGIESGAGAVPAEAILDLAFPERPAATREEWGVRITREMDEVAPEERLRGGEERPFGPETTLESFDDDPVPLKIHIAAGEKSDFTDPEAVVVDDCEERAVTRFRDRGEEGLEFGLG